MIFQLTLTAALFSLMAFVGIRRFDFRVLKYVLLVAIVAGLYFTWRPDDLTMLAHLIGVGRGADLLIYILTLIVFLLIIASALQIRVSNDRMTKLTRELALLHAKRPNDA